MASQAQIKANRRNSQKSTGPRTDEGKAAVSQNAFKHGLFVNKAVVRDESQQEYDGHREAVLAEWNPVGVTETIIAERLVNLTWRLERAQRMQNQSIDYLGLDELRKIRVEDFQTLYRKANAHSWDEPDVAGDHLWLGRLATRDWSNYRVLDKMLLYERRIENSMYKTMRELERLQKARKAEQAREARQQSGEGNPPAQRHSTDSLGGKLKKQTQFAPGLMGAMPFAERYYGDIARPEAARNKPNQSQSPASGGKSEALNPKSETKGTEKTKPIW